MGLFLYEFLKFKTTGEKEWKKKFTYWSKQGTREQIYLPSLNISSAAGF